MEGAKWCLFFRHLAEGILIPWVPVSISPSLTWAISWAQAPHGPLTALCLAAGSEHLRGWQLGCTEPPRAFAWWPYPAPNYTFWGFPKDSTASAQPQRGTEPGNPLWGGRGWLGCPTTAVSFWLQEATPGPSRLLSQCPGVALGWQPNVQHICSQDLGGLLLFSPLNFLYSSQKESREVKAKTWEGSSE